MLAEILTFATGITLTFSSVSNAFIYSLFRVIFIGLLSVIGLRDWQSVEKSRKSPPHYKLPGDEKL